MQQWWQYIRYYFFLCSNWGFRLANWMIAHEIKGEKRYQINTTGFDTLKHIKTVSHHGQHATIYMPAIYPILEACLQQIPPHSLQHFVDIGCGKGRAMCVAAHMGFTIITGIDFAKHLLPFAHENMMQTQKRLPQLQYHIMQHDASNYIFPATASCIFLFNPFDEIILKPMLQHLLQSIHQHPRTVYIIYINPLHKDCFIKAGFKEIYHQQKLRYLEASVLSMS